MSASREKQNRQAASGQVDPKTAREAQQRREEKRTNLLYGVIAAAVLVAVIASFVWRSDFIPKTTTAATIDGEKYTAAEVEYYYQTAYRNFVSNSQYSYFLSYLGLNTNATLKSQSINSTAAAMLGIELPDADAEGEEADSEADPLAPTGMTWHDYFLDEALDNMRVIQAALKAAEAEGFQYPAGVQAQYDDNMDALKAVAAASGISVSQYLKGNFGAGVTEKVYGEQLMRVLRYSAYADAYQDSLTYSDSELEEAYGADRNTYDHVSYEVVSFSGAAESTTDDEGNTVEPTEEEAAAALEAAQDLAQTVLDGFQDGGDLEELANENDGTYSKNENGTYSAGSVMSEWLYDSARKSGDASTLADGTVQYVVVFHDRFRDENPTIDIRHILVSLGTGSIAEGEEGYEDQQAQLKADAHAKAEELLAQWQSGEATEDSFAALALKESADGSKYDGGLYTEVYQGQMVTEFNDWCFDTARQSGDTGVVDTQYGSHVMYFSGVNAARWQTQVAANLRTEAYTAWEEDLVKDVTVQRSESGLKHIG
nr:peptidylprolyl isomerase [uncultured Oscillibacter sp.]